MRHRISSPSPTTLGELQAGGLSALIAGGNTDGDLPMLQWSAGRPGRTLQLVLRHTDAEREYEYDHDPILGSRTEAILAAAAENKWSVIDMASDWSTVHAS